MGRTCRADWLSEESQFILHKYPHATDMRYLGCPYHLRLTLIPTHWVCGTQPQDVFTEKAIVGFSETCVTHC